VINLGGRGISFKDDTIFGEGSVGQISLEAIKVDKKMEAGGINWESEISWLLTWNMVKFAQNKNSKNIFSSPTFFSSPQKI